MKRLRAYLLASAALMMLGLVPGGCTVNIFETSHTLKTSEMSPALFPSPLRDLAPKTFAFKEFKDIRATDDPTRMLKVGVHSFDLEDPPAMLVAQWIQNELERNGHRCLPDSPTVKADFLVEGTVFKFWVRQHAGWVRLAEMAEVATKLTISRVPADAGSLTKSYQGQHVLTGGAFTTTFDLWKPAINQALMAMVREMSTDPELRAFLAQWTLRRSCAGGGGGGVPS